MLQRLVTAVLLLLTAATLAHADISVFIYHRFGETKYPSTNIDVEVFARQLDYLATHQYKVLPLSEIARRVRMGEELPEKTVGLSVDDAFTSFAQEAMPLLQRHGFPVTLFVNTDSVGSPGYLDWAELKKLVEAGVEIGNHTASHAYLVEMNPGESAQQWQLRIAEDIARAKGELQSRLGVTPEIFAYTYGEYTGPVIDLLRQAGFLSAFAQQSGVVSAMSDSWTLPRFPMGGPYATLDGFIDKLTMRALPLAASVVVDPVLRDENPPVLRLRLSDPVLAAGKINCFAQAGSRCWVERDPETPGGIRVLADTALQGRRNKYTLTVRGERGWYWYSQLWINARRPVPARIDQP